MNTLLHYTLLLMLLLTCTGCNENDAWKTAAGFPSVDSNAKRIIDSPYNQEDAAKHIKMLWPLYRRYPDSATHAAVCIALGISYNEKGFADSMITYCMEALPYLEQHAASLTKDLGRCYFMLGLGVEKGSHPNFFLANNYLSKAALLCNAPGADTLFKPEFRVVVLYLASVSNRRCQLYKPSLTYGHAALSVGRQFQDSIPGPYGRAILEYTNILIENKEYDSAWYYCTLARQLNEQKIHSPIFANDIDVLSGWYYYARGLYDSAAVFCRRGIIYREQTDKNSGSSLFANYYSMADICNRLCKKQEAKKYLDKAQHLLDQDSTIADPSSLLDLTENKTHFNILYGSRTAAQELFIKFIQDSKDFYNKEQLKMAEAAYAEYDLANKERKIQSLDLERLSANASLRARSNLLAISALTSLLAIAAIVVLIMAQRQHKLKNAQQTLITEYSKIELEQQLLRTQMEPHFIFNTLTTLLTFIERKENKKASTYLLRFANLLQTSLENSKEQLVPLSEELNALDNYLELQRIRFDIPFDFEINREEDLDADDILIPPMLIQPLTENAIIHGFKGIGYRGFLQVDLQKKDGQLYCTVIDNGKGYQPLQKAGKKSSSTLIIRKRLNILSRQTGRPASLEIMGRPDTQGIKAELVVPFKVFA